MKHTKVYRDALKRSKGTIDKRRLARELRIAKRSTEAANKVHKQYATAFESKAPLMSSFFWEDAKQGGEFWLYIHYPRCA